MTTGEWQRLEELFHRAEAVPPEQRRAWIETLDLEAPLRLRLEALLEASDRAEREIDASLAAELQRFSGNSEISREGQTLGPWRIEEPIGAGGMATVYRARRADGAFEQQVAIKLLRGALLDPTARDRFLQERQLLAQLDHPLIARLLDGGSTPDGAPYLVMEHVNGVPLDRWCEDQELSVERRIDLFLHVCDAVAFAHSSLVLHRDLKPANILVAPDGRPRLLDFGIAKMLSPESHPMTVDARPLTPEYASPEQVQGHPLSTASDVYSLGVILYELLVGRRPHDVEGLDSLERQQRKVTREPDAPSTVTTIDPGPGPHDGLDRSTRRTRLRGDLDTIVLKSLRLRPLDRYYSVEAFANDLHRHRQGQPILARPQTLRYRLSRFTRRNPVGVGLSLLLMVVLVGATLISTSFGLRSERARQEAETRRQIAEQLNTMWQDALAAADPIDEQRSDMTVREVLATAERDLLSQALGEPRVTSNLLLTLGRSYRNLSLLSRSDSVLTRAADLARAGMPTMRRELVEALGEQGLVALDREENVRAIALLTEAVDASKPLRVEDPILAANALRLLGDAKGVVGALAASESLLVAATMALGHGDGEDVEMQRASIANSLAVTLREAGRLDRAKTWYETALEIYERRRGEHSVTAQVLTNLAWLQLERDVKDEPIDLLHRALDIQQRVFPVGHPQIAKTQLALARALRTVGRRDEALELFEISERTFRQAYGDSSFYVGTVLNSRAFVELELGQPERGVPALEQAAAIFEHNYGLEHPWTAAARHNVVSFRIKAKMLDGTEGLARDNLALRQRIFPAGHLDIGRSHQGLGQILLETGRASEALSEFDRALAIFGESVGPEHGLWRSTLVDRGTCLLQLGRRDEGRLVLQRAVALSDSVGGPEDPTARLGRAALAEVDGR